MNTHIWRRAYNPPFSPLVKYFSFSLFPSSGRDCVPGQFKYFSKTRKSIFPGYLRRFPERIKKSSDDVCTHQRVSYSFVYDGKAEKEKKNDVEKEDEKLEL